MDSQFEGDSTQRISALGVSRVTLFLAAALIGPGIFVYVAMRFFGEPISLATAFTPVFLVLGYWAAVALFVLLGMVRRKKGWSLPFEKQWHIAATLESDAILCHLLLSAAACLFVGATVRHLIPAGMIVVMFLNIFLAPIRDRRGRYGLAPALIPVCGSALMLFPVRIYRLYGPSPGIIAAGVCLFAIASVCLWLTLVRKSEDAWLREQKLEEEESVTAPDSCDAGDMIE